MKKKSYDIIIIGGGPAGLMAAVSAAESGKKVLILEKNSRIGEKLRISGGGRCNITNAEPSIKDFLKNYGKSAKFLHSPFSVFNNKNTFTFFEEKGMPLVIQEKGRVFPYTEKASDVVYLFERLLKELSITLMVKSQVIDISCEGNSITGVTVKNGKDIQEYKAQQYVLATGGVSHPETGSTGDGFVWLKKIGHTVIDPTPSIVPVAVEDEWIKNLAGKKFDNVKITFFNRGKKSFAKEGRILATHFGLSGPLILNSAHTIADLLHEGKVSAEINLFPGKDLGMVERDIIELFNVHKNKSFKTVFKEFVPSGMGNEIIQLFPEIDPEIKVHSITKDMRKLLVKRLTALPVTITELMGFDRAVIADGGVPLDEIDMKTMRSKKIGNLFITGDLLHVNRPSGGYSLQLCWTTGYVAGINI